MMKTNRQPAKPRQPGTLTLAQLRRAVEYLESLAMKPIICGGREFYALPILDAYSTLPKWMTKQAPKPKRRKATVRYKRDLGKTT